MSTEPNSSLHSSIPGTSPAGHATMPAGKESQTPHDQESQEQQRLRLMRQIGRDILSERSFRATADTALAFLFDALPIDEVYVVLHDEPSDMMVGLQTSWPGFENPYREPLAPHREVHEQLLRDRSIQVRDVSQIVDEMPVFRNLAKYCASLLVVPMEVKDEYVGVLLLTSKKPHEFATETVELVREVADWLAIAVRQNKLLAEEQRLRRQQEILREVAASITAGLELDVVLRSILDQLERVLPTVSSAVFLRRENDRFELAAYRGHRLDLTNLNTLHETPPAHFAMMLQSHTPILIEDTGQDEDWVVIPGDEYILNWLGVPLIVDERIIGFLTLDRDEPASFTEADIPLATMFADQAAIAIENARLFSAEQQYAERLAREVHDRTSELEAIYAMSAVAGPALDLEDVLTMSLAMAVPAFKADAGTIHLLNEKDDTLRLAAAWPNDEGSLCHDRYQIVPLDHPVYKQVIKAEATWQASKRELLEMGVEGDIPSFAGAPLRANGRLVGVLSLLGTRPRVLQPNTLSLLSAISERIAIATENVQLRLRTRETAILQERERLAMELHDAVTQALYSVLLFTEAAREAALAGDDTGLQSNLASVRQLTRQAMGEMRVLLHDLRPESLARMGLAQALQQRLDSVERRAGLQARLTVVGPLDRLPPTIEETLYRVALEALSNVLRHAQATTVELLLRRDTNGIHLEVRDNGLGLQGEEPDRRTGHGLRNMRRRMSNIGGQMTITPQPAGGTEICLWAPLKDAPPVTGAQPTGY